MFGRITLACLAMTLCAAPAHAQGFDPGALKAPPKGKPNEVLVLATAHLAQLPATFQPASLDGVLGKLAAWAPKVIVIESLSGPECATMRQYPGRYDGAAERYCRWDPGAARAGDGLDDKLAGVPEQRQFGRGPRGEDTLIAAPLAAMLGHERVVPMDDHSIGDAPPTHLDGYGAALAKAWDNPVFARRLRDYERLHASVDSADKALQLFRVLNAPAHARLVYDSDFGPMLGEPSPQGFGRLYVATWEQRNLRMASNIREAMANRPGSRTLVIVGASHKGYLEAYLHQMHDVTVVAAGPVLQ